MQDIKTRIYAPYDREGCLNAFKTNVPTYFTLDEVRQFEEWLDYLPNTRD